jgi:hypothetical protein
VADFGSGDEALQIGTIMHGSQRELSAATIVDVIAGGTVTTGIANVFVPSATWEVRSPTWHADGGRIGHVLTLETVHGLARLPDGSGFVYSVTEGAYFGDDRCSNLFLYEFARAVPQRVTSYVGDFVGQVRSLRAGLESVKRDSSAARRSCERSSGSIRLGRPSPSNSPSVVAPTFPSTKRSPSWRMQNDGKRAILHVCRRRSRSATFPTTSRANSRLVPHDLAGRFSRTCARTSSTLRPYPILR